MYFLLQLDHTNIVKFVGICYKPKNPQPILVTEEVTSTLLYHMDKVKTLQITEQYRFSCGVSEGLAHLHDLKIAHLNLFTKSILLTDNLTVKIGNFEYACYFLDDKVASSSSSVVPGGTSFSPWKFRDDPAIFDYLPALYYKRSYDSVDIYSFGCVVYNIFTYNQPEKGVAPEVTGTSIPAVENLVNDCVNGKLENMQAVYSAMKM